MKKHFKKFISLVLVLVMLCGIAPIAKVEAEAANYVVNGKTIPLAGKTVGTPWGYTDCWNFAQQVYNTLWGTSFSSYRGTSDDMLRQVATGTDRAINVTNTKNFISMSALGATIRVVDYIDGNDGQGSYMHSMILIQKDSAGFTIYDSWAGAVRIKYYTWSGFVSDFANHKYFKYIKWPGAPLYSSAVSTTGISLDPDRKTIDIGESVKLTATVSPSNATNKTVTWTSSDTSVATVSGGTIKGVKAGVATITAKASGGQTATCKVVVFPSKATPTTITEYNGHLYELYDYTSSWKDARDFCEARGGHLVTITSEEENDVVYNLAQKGIKARYCLGATDETTESSWLWTTGEEFSYSNFQSGEDTDSTDYEEEDYLFMYTNNGQWGDVRNYAWDPTVNGFICEYESLLTYDNVTVIGNKVYELYEREYPIAVATTVAESRSGNLVSLTSKEEQTALIAWIQANSDILYISIGANDLTTEGTWEWSSGEKWEYTSWVDGEPNDTNGIEDNAILILDSGKWNDVTGANAYSFVIEYDLDEWLDLGNDANDIVFNELPEGADPDDYEIVTEYRYRDKETKTDTASKLDGWELYDSETTYGTWSKVQSTKTKPTTSDTLQITGTWKQYHYYHHCNKYSDGNWYVDSIAYGTQSVRHDTYLNSTLPAISFQDQGNKQAYGGTGASVTSACDYNFYIWFYADEATFYNYQTRSKTTTNYFYKYGDWSDWSTTPVTTTDDREVESRTVYVLKDHKHTYSDWIIETEVTCTADGLKSRTCTDCGDGETEVIPATGHQNTIWITEQEPNCTVDGYKDEYCLDCTELIDTETIPATGHLDTIWETKKEPTCDDVGCKEEYCLACGEKIGTEEIPATGHSYSTEWTIDINPTCTEEGSKSHHCTVCGDKADVTAITLLGHEYKVVATAEEHPHKISYKCSRCTETKQETSSSADCAVCNFSYTNIDDKTCKITGYIGSANSFVLPGIISGRVVSNTTTGAFKNNTTLTSVRIENGVQGLGSLAFLGCTSLAKIVIPESVSSIGTNAFYNCASNFTMYCYRDTYAMQYAVNNSLNYMIMDVGETKNSTIDYNKELIFTSKRCIRNLNDILYVPSTSMAFAEASFISGNNEVLGTGTKVTVFDNNDISSEYTLIVDGDINGDSACDVIDCAQVALASNGFTELEGAYLEAGDADDNGEIDVTDYQSIVNNAMAG